MNIEQRISILEKKIGIKERFFTGKEDSPYYSVAKKLKSTHNNFLKGKLPEIFESQSSLTYPDFLIKNLKSKLKFSSEYSVKVTDKFYPMTGRRNLFLVSNNEDEFTIWTDLNSRGFNLKEGAIRIAMSIEDKRQDVITIAAVSFNYTEKEYENWETELYFEVAKRSQDNRIPLSGNRGRSLLLQVAKEMSSDLDFSIKTINVYEDRIEKLLSLGYTWDLKNFRHHNKWA